MNIKGLKKAAVLAALYNASKPQGMGFMHYDAKPMTEAEAETILQLGASFDYLKGRVMKINLSGDEVDTWGYNRDNGTDAAENVIKELQLSGNANSPDIQMRHNLNTLESAVDVESKLGQKSEMKTGDGTMVTSLGLADVADKLGPKVKEITRRRN